VSSLYKRATPRQTMVLRMIEGAVRNAAHAHPGRSIDDARIARSIAKRAAGTLTAAWPAMLAAPRVWSEGNTTSGPRGVATAARHVRSGGGSVVSAVTHDRKGASEPGWRAPVRALQRAIGAEAGNAKCAGNSEREAALVGVLRLMARYIKSEQMPDPRKRWNFEP
jgi:hypothetical protein